MNKHEWIEHLRSDIATLEEDAQGQTRLAEHQKSFPDQQAVTLSFANSLRLWAEQTRIQLKRLEDQSFD
jgi:hypothetical protein